MLVINSFRGQGQPAPHGCSKSGHVYGYGHTVHKYVAKSDNIFQTNLKVYEYGNYDIFYRLLFRPVLHEKGPVRKMSE